MNRRDFLYRIAATLVAKPIVSIVRPSLMFDKNTFAQVSASFPIQIETVPGGKSK